ncbi:hypothetical protein [Nocardia vulneris]|uniref:hypothetical protein n=1 Tax=Nocardia vulneris TaxID=1141657 RepID=UPI0009E54EF7|nr:hypothetical protein [Nocardia vulneris]
MFVPAPLGDPRIEVLADGAFGARPGLAAAELPTAPGALASWYRAVILGGQGRYAAARVELRIIGGASTDPVLLSLAASTTGSLLRQLGWHARAAAYDGRAAALVSARALGDRADPAHSRFPAAEAICDALTGLAADALGTGRLALSWRLLQRVDELLPGGELGWRPALRRHWVGAETALAAGLVEPARRDAAAALELAEHSPSVRHRVKSRLLVAAAAAAANEHDRSRELAEQVGAQCREHGLLPLRWASAMLRAGLSVPGAAAEAEDCAATIVRRGGRFRPMTVG